MNVGVASACITISVVRWGWGTEDGGWRTMGYEVRSLKLGSNCSWPLIPLHLTPKLSANSVRLWMQLIAGHRFKEPNINKQVPARLELVIPSSFTGGQLTITINGPWTTPSNKHQLINDIYIPMNSLENRRMTSTMRECTSCCLGPQPRRALTKYARMKDEAELFADHKRVDLEFRDTSIILKAKDLYPGPRWNPIKIGFFTHLGKLEARHHIAMQDFLRGERVAYNSLPAHDGTAFPTMYAKVSIKIEPAYSAGVFLRFRLGQHPLRP